MSTRAHAFVVLALTGALAATAGGCGTDDGGRAASSTVESTSTTTSPARTTTTVAVSELVVLRPDGLQVAALGAPDDEVVATLAEILGAPSGDDLLTGPINILPWGYYAINAFRAVSWDEWGLTLIFSDAPSPWRPNGGELHWIAWWYSEPGREGVGLHTPEGVSIGSTADDVRAAYPGVFIHFQLECGEGWHFATEPNAVGELDRAERLRGRFEGAEETGPGPVQILATGIESSC
jgi:hypothetical protein